MKYDLSIISYFDILGMTELLAEARNNPTKIYKILTAFRTLSDLDQESKDEWGWHFVNFSDLVVRAVPIMSDANRRHRLGLVFHEAMEICNIQANLIARGVLVRGCMTIENIATEEGLIFGEGLARAYAQVSTKAKFPRVILDSHLMSMFRSLSSCVDMNDLLKSGLIYDHIYNAILTAFIFSTI